MAKLSSHPGKIVVSSIKLSSFDGSKPPIEIRKLCTAVDIWEDIRKPSIVVDIFVADAVGLVTSFPIRAEEKIEMTVNYPGMTPVTLKLVVVSINDFTFDDAGKGAGYYLNCASEEVWLGSMLSIMKGYNTTIDGIVKDLVTNQLQSSKTVTMEPTKGIQQYVIPRLSPFEAIDILKRRAVSATSAGSFYMFYENKKGYVFKTFEQLFKEGVPLITSKNRTFVRGDMTIADKATGVDNPKMYRTIINMHNGRRSDSSSKIAEGALNNVTYAFDFATKTVRRIDFSLQQKGSKFVLGDSSGKLPTSSTFMSKYGSKNAIAFFVPVDSTKGENFIADNLGAKVAYETLINQHNVIVEVPGDFEMSAGDAVKLSIPQQQGTTGTIEKEDPIMSGTYIIMALRHMIVLEPSGGSEYTMSMELLKGNTLA